MRRVMVIRSTLDQLSAVKQWMRELVERVGLGPREAFDMTLAVHEAVVNAILHGNKKDPGKRVEILHLCKNGQLTVQVKDEGGGFDVQGGLAQARKSLAPTAPSGRGLLLITKLADEVIYNERGNTVQLTKFVRQRG
ncbi:MAG: ATP-binding protein [Armatimonadota bacterium]